jgi:hypothetical protein
MRDMMVARLQRRRVLGGSLRRVAHNGATTVVAAFVVIWISWQFGSPPDAHAITQPTSASAEVLPWPFAPAPEFFAFGESLQQRARKGSSVDLAEIIDFARFRERATERLAGGDAALQSLLGDEAEQSLNQNLTGPVGFFQQVANHVAQGGSYEFLRISSKLYLDSPRTVAVFRLISSDGSGFNYHDYVLERTAGDANHRIVKAVDIYSYDHGEDLSRNVRRDIVSRHGELPQLSADDPMHGYRENMSRIQQISDAVKRSDYQKAAGIFSALPETVKRDQSLLVMLLRAAANHGKEAFDSAYAAYPGDYKTASDPREPGAPARELLAIDGFLSFQDYGRALECVDNLERAVGDKDSYLNAARAGILIAAGEAGKAWEHAKKALESAQQHGGGSAARIDALWKLMRATAAAAGREPQNQRESRFAATADVLRDQNVPTSFIKNLSSFPQFNAFTTSGAYARLCRP